MVYTAFYIILCCAIDYRSIVSRSNIPQRITASSTLRTRALRVHGPHVRVYRCVFSARLHPMPSSIVTTRSCAGLSICLLSMWWTDDDHDEDGDDGDENDDDDYCCIIWWWHDDVFVLSLIVVVLLRMHTITTNHSVCSMYIHLLLVLLRVPCVCVSHFFHAVRSRQSVVESTSR